MIERPDPDALLAGPLGQWLAGQQALRDATKQKVRQRRTWAVIAALVVGVLAAILFRDFDGLLWGAMIGGLPLWAWAESARKKVTDTIKSEINQAVARALGLEYGLAVTQTAPFELAKAFALVPGYDDASFEDQWSGHLGALPFLVHEAKLTEQQGSGKSRRTVTVFEGSVMTVGFTRKFLGTTLIERERNRRGWFGGQKERIELGGIGLDRVDMVDPRFEDLFAVWSSDGVEAHYLVHPEYVERLVAVETAYHARNIRALFRDGALLIVLETGNMFESGSLEAGEDRALLTRTIEQFGSLCDLAAKLNERPRAGFN